MVENILGNCRGKMQNVLESLDFKHWLSDNLEERSQKSVCS